MQSYRSQPASLIFLLLILLALPGCGARSASQSAPVEPDTPEPAPTLRVAELAPTAEPIVPAPTVTGPKNEPLLGFLPAPENLPLQIAYVPGAAGGGGSYFDCGGTTVPGTGETPFGFTGERRPYLFTVGNVVDNGAYIGICYFNFPVGPVEERIVGPDSSVVITRNFTIDFPDDLDTTDFTALPEDLPGTYTVSVLSVAGEFTTSFEVTGQRAPSPEPDFLLRVVALGRGTNGPEPRSGDLEYLYLRDFAPSESVKLYFFERCTPQEQILPGRYIYNHLFRFGVEVQVNEEGYLFWPLPPEVREELGDRRGYRVLASGTTTNDKYLAHDAVAIQSGSLSNLPQLAGATFIDGAVDDQAIPCPSALGG